MAVEKSDIEAYMAVGTTLMFHVAPVKKSGPRYKTVIRGWRRGSYIMCDRPKLPNNTYVALQEGLSCVFRYLHEGRACAFDSQIIDWDTRRFNPYMRIVWPKAIEHVSFRRFERVKLHAHCMIAQGDTLTEEEIRDISIGGCGIYSRIEFPKNSVAFLDFQLPDGSHAQRVKAIVRNVRELGKGYLLGCQFAPEQEVVERDIAFFITTALARDRGEEMMRHSRAVLLIEDDRETRAALRHQFAKQKLEVSQAHNAIDGFYRLRTGRPPVVVVSHSLSDLSGVQLCRTIRKNKEYAHTAVFVFGGDDEKIQEMAHAAGAVAWFPKDEQLPAQMTAAIVNLMSKLKL
jgi:CheY-like chemotaxis protein/c-di-GMP-binding flagellar brake protein YcgR